MKNAERTLAECLKSIFEQTYRDFEIVAVDGGSTDGTVDILHEFGLKPLYDGGRGLGYARQLVIQKARGKYVQWVDGDHVLLADFLERQVEFMEKHPELAGAEAIMDWLGDSLCARLEGYIWLLYCRKRAQEGYLKTIGSAGSIYRVSALREVGGYDFLIKGSGEDADICLRLGRKGWKFKMNPNARYYHRVRASWLGLAREYLWWGEGAHYAYHKHPNYGSPWRFFPPIAFLAGLKHGWSCFQMTGDPWCSLIPFHYAFKRLAWCLGYLRAHLKRYQPCG